VEPPAAKRCANCNAESVPGAEFCASCGTRAPTEAARTPLVTTASPARESTFRALGEVAAIIAAFFSATALGLVVSVALGAMAMSVSLRSTPAAALAGLALLVVAALLVVLIVTVARGKMGTSRILSAFVVTFAVVCGGGLTVCSGISFMSVFGR
jgi:hypothetical protein